MKKKKYLIISILIVTIVSLLILASTYAYFKWTNKEDYSFNVSVSSEMGECIVVSDNDAFLEPVSDKSRGRIIKLKGKQFIAQDGRIAWKMNIKNVNDLNHSSFKYQLVNDTTGQVYESDNLNNFSSIKNGDTITFTSSENIKYNVDNNYSLYLWIDGNSGDNPLTMSGKTLDFDLNCEVTEAPLTLGNHIMNLYNDNIDKINTAKNGPTGGEVEYYYAPSVSLMNDRLGGTESLDSGIGNIRYYGMPTKDGPNNYILLGNDKVNDLYRIIGLFKDVELEGGTTKDLIKVIKNDSIGNIAWDSSDNNNWARPASLNTYLNETFYNTIDKVYQDKILSVKWNLGAMASSSIFSNQAYIGERKNMGYGSNPNRSPGKVALMLPSDYGYAVNFNSCKGNLFNYDNVNCKDNNWLYVQNKIQWLLASHSSRASNVWHVDSSGYVYDLRNASNAFGVRPVFYLDSELAIASGDGSKDAPYEIK